MTSTRTPNAPLVKARRIGHIGYETSDFDGVVEHYSSVVGLSVAHSDRNDVFMTTRVGQLAVHLKRSDAPRVSEVSFEIGPDKDLGELKKTFDTAGVDAELVSDAAPGMSRCLAFRDPAGNTIQLFSGWGSLGHSAARGVDPIKLGHVAFVVGDPKAMCDFYSRTLGFAVSDWVDDFFVFMRCGSDHHTVNFLRADGGDRIHHVAFEMKDAAHLLGSCDVLAAHKVKIDWGPVRHGPGHNVATYHRAPDGHIIELFSELDMIVDEELGYFDPRPWHEEFPQRPKVWGGNQRRDVWGPGRPADFLSAMAALET